MNTWFAMGETGEKENKLDGVEGLGGMWQHSVKLWDSKSQ
jgi:hypothetical protein